MPAQPPQMPSPKSTPLCLDLGQAGRFAEGSGKRRKNLATWSVLAASYLVLNPSRESRPIGYVDNSGRFRGKTSRFNHGAGWKAFF